MVTTVYKKPAILSAVFVVILLFTASSISAAGIISLSANSVIRGDPVRVGWLGFNGNVNIAVYRGNEFWVYVETDAPGFGYKDINTEGWEIRSDYRVKIELLVDKEISTTSGLFSVSIDRPPAPSGLRIKP